jgi:two-component system, sensor histidine kinase YesM
VTSDFHRDGKANALYLSKNIIQNNHSLGLLVIELNGSLIERMLNRAQINDQNSIFLLSSDGETLFQNEFSS